MKKTIFLSIALLSFFFISCGGGKSGDASTPSDKPLTPQAFNQTAMDVFKAAQKAMDNFDSQITAGVKTKDLKSITTAADKATAEVDVQIEKLKAVNAPEGGQEYKDAVLKSLDGVKSIIETGKKYGDLPEGYSRVEFNNLEKEYNNKRTELSATLKKVGTAASAFTKNIK